MDKQMKKTKNSIIGITVKVILIIIVLVVFLVLLNKTPLLKLFGLRKSLNQIETKEKVEKLLEEYKMEKETNNSLKLIDFLNDKKETENINEVEQVSEKAIELELDNYFIVLDVEMLLINKVELSNETHFYYEFEGIVNDKARILINIKNKDKLIENIQLPDGDILYISGKNSISMDFDVENEQDYEFIIKTVDGTKKAEVINLIIPTEPEVEDSVLELPTFTSSGIIASKTTIQYDERHGLLNYYKYGTSEKWNTYIEEIDIPSSQLTARIVNPKCVGFYIDTVKNVQNPKNAITLEAYDNDKTTYTKPISISYANIDSTVWKKILKMQVMPEYYRGYYRSVTIYFYDSNDNIIGWSTKDTETGVICELTGEIPIGCQKISLGIYSDLMKHTIYDIEIIENEELDEDNDTYRSLIPTITENTNIKNGVIVSVSDSFRTSANHAVDGNYGTGWSTDNGNHGEHWFMAEFSKPRIVKAYDLTGMYSWGTPYDFQLQASNDKENWINLEELHQGVSGSKPNSYNVTLNNTNAYKYYRIYCPRGGWTWGSSGGCCIQELKLYGT